MTRDESLESLSSSSAHVRLKAARVLARNSNSGDLQRLRAALRDETVSYVRTALELAIKRGSSFAAPAVEDTSEEFEIPKMSGHKSGMKSPRKSLVRYFTKLRRPLV